MACFCNTVLVIDDDPLQLEILRDHLEGSRDMDVITCPDGREALAALRGPQRIDLIISDIHMPEVDGIELLQALSERADRPPLVLISGGAESQLKAAKQLAQCYSLTCLSVLRKPVSFRALDQAVEAAFDASRELQPRVEV